ncbi:MAG: hypothetical protein ABMA14_06855 [Hyphomonadaceae bacterium]
MANGSGQIPVLDCVRSAWQFLLRNGRRLAPAALIVALVAEIGPIIGGLSGAADAESASALSANLGSFIAMLPGVLASLALTAAVLRLAIRDEFIGATGLTLGADEVRLLGVLAGLMCIIIPFGSLVFLVVSVVVIPRLASSPEELQRLLDDPDAMSTALENSLGPAGSAAFLFFMFAAIGIVIYVATRLFMMNAATIGERRVVMFQTWKWSRGNVLRMLGALLLTWLPASLIDTMIYSLAATVFSGVASPGNAALTIPIFHIITTFVTAMLSIPSIVVGAILYKGLRPADFVAK